MKKGFTIAEILIVLVVIGILGAILIPNVEKMFPDKNLMKFKKGHQLITSAISELVNSDKYYLGGDLGVLSNGELVTSPTKFCETLADVLVVKSVNCASHSNNNTHLHHFHMGLNNETWKDEWIIDSLLDRFCNEEIYVNEDNPTATIKEEIITQDGIVFYQPNPHFHFGYIRPVDSNRLFGSPPNTFDSTGFDQIYKPLCMDIDGIGKGEAPFGYGIRADGKMITSKRINEWLEKE